MSAPFRPPRGITVELPYRSLVLRADPDFEYKNRHQLFYEFSNGREFREDENQHGAYLPSGPVSVALTGVGAAGSAGIVAQLLPTLIGVGASGTAAQVVGVASLPSGPISVALGGVGASGNAGFVLETVGLLTGVSSVGATSHVTAIGTEDDKTISGVSATGTAGTIRVGGTDSVPLTGVAATGSAGTIAFLHNALINAATGNVLVNAATGNNLTNGAGV